MKWLFAMAWLVALGSASAKDADAGIRYATPVLHWTSKDEKGVYGYIIYRSAKADGPFLRINKRIVPAIRPKSPVSGEGARLPIENRYEFKDVSADPAQTYYYSIDAVSRTGLSKQLTRPIRREPRALPFN